MIEAISIAMEILDAITYDKHAIFLEQKTCSKPQKH